MPIRSRRGSEVFRKVLADARKEVLLGSDKAGAFAHHGIRGDERAAALANFFRQRLPERFGVGKGEALDSLDRRTGQLDLILYDQAKCAPISIQAENLLLPCEALYVVIEVKTVVTQHELLTAYSSANKVRALRPFNGRFIAPLKKSVQANHSAYRCMYVVFGYSSDLANDANWVVKEYSRVREAAEGANSSLDCVDRVIVLDRGIINPVAGRAKWEAGDAESVFLESYLNIVNFVGRESKRRPPVDWQKYGPRTSKGWKNVGVAQRNNARHRP